MRLFSAALAITLIALSSSAAAQDSPPKVQNELVAFHTASSQARLARSKHTADFFLLANQFEPQMNGGTCGPTSSVIVLNALRPQADKRRPVDATAYPAEMRKGLPKGLEPVKPRYTQRAFFDTRLEKVKTKQRFYGKPDAKGKRDFGLQLRQLHDVLENHGLNVELRVVSAELSEASIRRDLLQNLKRPGDYVIINYHRKTLGQPGGGHISPLAAYDEKSDSFLVMDVNPNKAPWVWVPAKLLFKAMRTKDTVENRGYVLVSERSPKPATN